VEKVKTRVFRSSRYPAARKPESLGGTTKTETAGYVSGPQQIERLFNAGQILDNFRIQNYDFKAGEPDGNMDPTRRRNYDLADSTADLAYLEARREEAVKELKEIEKKEKAEAAAKKKAEAEIKEDGPDNR